jgi:hypothetical protein
MRGEFPINSAARNSLWLYPVERLPRFAGAPAVIETTRSYEMPNVTALPGGGDVRVEFYGGAYSFWLDGERRRVYVGRFDYVSFPSEEEARYAFLTLWREVELLESPSEVGHAAARWLEKWRRERSKM